MNSTHRLFHVIITTSAFAVGCGGGSPAPQEPADTPASITAAKADGKPENAGTSTPSGDAPKTAEKKTADRPKAKDGTADKDKSDAKAAKPAAQMGVAGW